MTVTAESVLKSTAMFSALSPEDLDVVASLSDFIDLQDGRRVFGTGDPSKSFYVVVTGEIVIRTGDEHQQTDIARFLVGDSLGELDLFTGDARNADAFAVGSTRLLEFPHGSLTLSDLSREWPAVSARLFRAFLIHISARIRGANSLVKENSPLVRELRRQVYVDKLTGLFNKTYFEENLGKTLASEPSAGLFVYKPDNFKQINDEFGHEAGDKVLKYVADALREFVPNRDMLFRYMGNENAVIVPGCNRDELKSLAQEIVEFLKKLDLSPILRGADARLSISAGLALAPEHGTDAQTLIDAAHPLTLEGRRRGGNLILFPEDSDGL